MTPILLVALALVAASGCRGSQSVTGPETSVRSFGSIEQVLKLDANPAAFSGTRAFHLTSQLVNRGVAPVTLRVRTCYLRPGIDLVSTPAAEFVMIAIPGCIEEPDVITLLPGESSGTVFFHGTIEHAGRYKLAVRHAIDPEFWGKLDIVVR